MSAQGFQQSGLPGTRDEKERTIPVRALIGIARVVDAVSDRAATADALRVGARVLTEYTNGDNLVTSSDGETALAVSVLEKTLIEGEQFSSAIPGIACELFERRTWPTPRRS
jgi:hypothetical protein